MMAATPTVNPILLEIVEGTIESSRKEMELQVERTARSTVIREQHDYRAAVFDRRGRGISTVSSAANVQPILEGFAEDIEEGDLFIWNDPYKGGGISHLPDICITAPVTVGGPDHRLHSGLWTYPRCRRDEPRQYAPGRL